MAKKSRAGKRARSSESSAPPADTGRPLWNRLIFFVALFGILLTVHFWVQAERGFSHGCLGLSDPAEVGQVGCSAVVASDAGRVLGVSNIAWGFLFYLVIGGLAFATVFAEGRRAGLRRASFVLSAIGFLYSAFLTIYQLATFDDVCVLCLVSAATVTVLLGLHLVEFTRKIVPRFDTAGMVREMGVFALATFVALLLIVGDLLFVNQLGTRGVARAASEAPVPEAAAVSLELTPQQAAACQFTDDPAPLESVDALLSAADQFHGDPDAPVRVIDFLDPNCPHCKTLHERLEPVVAANRDRARFYYRPYPIWGFSMPQAQALYLARDQGKFFEMLDAQYENQKPGVGLSPNELIDIAEDIGLDVDRFAEGLRENKYLLQIQAERSLINQIGVQSFPQVAIDGRFVAQSTHSMSSACLNELIGRAYRAHVQETEEATD